MAAFNVVRQVVLRCLDLAADTACVIDSLPVPAVAFHLVPGATGDWPAHGARFGRIASKKQVIFGYRLHLLVTLNGVILDFELAPANATDLTVGCELLAQHTDLTVLGDKAYVGAPQAADLWEHNRIRLLTVPRRNQQVPVTAAVKHLHSASGGDIMSMWDSSCRDQPKCDCDESTRSWRLTRSVINRRLEIRNYEAPSDCQPELKPSA
jgi:hypothetical protein